MSTTQKYPGNFTTVRTALEEIDDKGAFKRVASSFRNIIRKGTRFEPEPGRYHLYISYACPWASRCLAVLYMKGLEDVVGLSVVHPTWNKTKPDNSEDTHNGWVFKNPDDPPIKNALGNGLFPCDGCIPDIVNGAKNIRELYEKSHDTLGKYTVPVLWCKKEGTIVCNESEIIMEVFNSEFNDFARNPKLDLFPKDLKDKIDEVNAWVYPTINDGVYRCGFAMSQQAYEEAFEALFKSMDRLEEILGKQRYLCGNHVTSSDIRAFVTLVRFDEVYVVFFKCNKKMIRNNYPNIFNYVKDVYQLPGVSRSVNMKHIKRHYYSLPKPLSSLGIIPVGNPDDFSTPHDRERFK